MPGFFFAMMAACFASLGGRDQLLMAQLSAGLGQRVSLMLSACAAAVVTSAVMAVGGAYVAAMLSPGGKLMLVAFALALAALELAWPIRRKELVEPTQSLFAIALVLTGRQIGDGARFLVFAIAAATGAPVLAGAGGALGSVASLGLGWALGSALLDQRRMQALRWLLAALLLLGAAYAALAARGVLA